MAVTEDFYVKQFHFLLHPKRENIYIKQALKNYPPQKELSLLQVQLVKYLMLCTVNHYSLCHPGALWEIPSSHGVQFFLFILALVPE